MCAVSHRAHQAAIGMVATAAHMPRRRPVAKCHDAVKRCDEVRVDDSVTKSQTAVDALEVRRHLVTGQLRLVEDVERFDQWSDRWPAIERNSVRSCGSVS